MTRKETAMAHFREGYNCSQSLVLTFADLLPLEESVLLKMSSSFGGGLGRLREICGVVSAAALVLGILKGYDDPEDYEAKKRHYALVREFAERFRERNGSISCRELLTRAGLQPESGGAPEPRSEEFYRKRPCPRLAREAASILDEMLQEHGNAGK